MRIIRVLSGFIAIIGLIILLAFAVHYIWMEYNSNYYWTDKGGKQIISLIIITAICALFYAVSGFLKEPLRPRVKELKVIHLQFGITFVALSIAVVHLIWPTLTIDGISVTLLFIALIPWLAPVFKSLEFPGGFKVEYRDFELAKTKADRAGLLTETQPRQAKDKYSFQLIAEHDPQLALAGLRIEIEKRLVEIAESEGIQEKKIGISRLLRILVQKQRLTGEQTAVLADMIGLLNSAVHARDIDNRAAEWALNVGPRLLGTLEARILR